MSNSVKILGFNIYIENVMEADMETFASIINGYYSEGDDVVFVEYEDPIAVDASRLQEAVRNLLTNLLVPASESCNCQLGEFILSLSKE